MSSKNVLWLIAGVLLAAGAVFALTPVTKGGYDCGRAFGNSFGNDLRATLGGQPRSLVGDCQDGRGQRKMLALVLLIPGLIVGGTAAVMQSSVVKPRPAT